MHAIPPDAYLMLIGAMKSGTSTLFDLLSLHPNVCPSAVKEPEYFSENQGHGLAVDRYQDLWAFDPSVHTYALEASTGYAKFPREPRVAERIHAHGLNPVFLFIVRNPFHRIESDYNWSRGRRWFDPAVAVTADRYTDFSRYFAQLEPYRVRFGRERIEIVDFELLAADPDALLADLCGRLGLPLATIETSGIVSNPTRTRSSLRRLADRYRLMGEGIRRLPDPVRSLLSRIDAGASGRRPDRRHLTDDERVVIFEKLHRDMRQFQLHYGFPVDKWGF
jgi:hypothetical protein